MHLLYVKISVHSESRDSGTPFRYIIQETVVKKLAANVATSLHLHLHLQVAFATSGAVFQVHTMIQPQLSWGDRARGRHFRRFRRLLVRHDAFWGGGGRHFARGGTTSPEGGNVFLKGGIIPSDAACCPQMAAEYLLRASCCIWRAASCLQRAAFNLLSHDDMLSEDYILHSESGTTSPEDGNTFRGRQGTLL